MAPQDAPGPDRRVARARLSLRTANPHPVEPAYRRIAAFGGWLMRRLTRQDWDDAGRLPSEGGVVVVANHVSNADPLVVAHYLIWNGRWPRFLAKVEVFSMPLVGWVARATGQIPVQRGSEQAAASLVPAEDALRGGACILVYPEGTITTDPDGWPMTGRTGAARLALNTGAPLVPLGQWGAQRLLGGKRPAWPRLLPVPTMTIRTGPAIDLADLAGRTDPEAVQIATERMMAAITDLVAQIRGESAPAERLDPRLGERVAQRHVRPGSGAAER